MPKISLKAARVNAGYTIAQAADIAGVSISTIKSWEAGKTFPSQPKIEALCAAYKMPYDNIDFNPKN